MIKLTGAHPPEHRLEVGDVVMVHEEITPKPGDDGEEKEPYTWRYFGLVLKVRLRTTGRLIVKVIGGRSGLKDRHIFFGGPGTHVWYLPEEEWPDGVWALRTKLILTGEVDMDL